MEITNLDCRTDHEKIKQQLQEPGVLGGDKGKIRKKSGRTMEF